MLLLALALAIGGVVAILAGWAALSGLGARFRVGRLLAVTPQVSLEMAQQLAAAGEQRYVRVHGRISSDEEFPDEHDRPLVYRRRRLLVAGGPTGWQVVGDEREAVPFGVEQRGTFIALDAAQLEDGLVVIPREAEGRVADLPPAQRAGLDPAAPTRLLIEQVSAVEHAFACGVPAAGPAGTTVMRAGTGRPLILTTLEIAAAMRILGRGRRRRIWLAAGLLVTGPVLLLAGLVVLLAG
jgi:hypothetical protein